MRRALSLLVVTFVCAATLLGAQDDARRAEDLAIGTWVGTWDGESTGEYTISIERDATGELGGTVETMPDSGMGYQADFTSIVVDGAKITMEYVTPGGEDVESEAAIDGDTLKGTWKAYYGGTTSLAASGTFTGSKK